MKTRSLSMAETVWTLHNEGKSVDEIKRAVRRSKAYVEAVLAAKPVLTRSPHDTRSAEVIDPFRADRLLRRWSWEGPEQTVREGA